MPGAGGRPPPRPRHAPRGARRGRAGAPAVPRLPPPRDRLPVAAAGPPPRLRKAWRYAGIFGEELMVCAGVVRVGPARQAFWAVWDRRAEVLRERTRLLPRRQVAL